MQSAIDDIEVPLPGKRRYGGSRKGRPNFTTRQVQNSIMSALDHLGGVNYLVWLGKKHPQAFSGLVGRLLPQAKPDEPMAGLVVNVVQLAADVGPTPGVLASPIREHIAPPIKRIEVIDADGDEGGRA